MSVCVLVFLSFCGAGFFSALMSAKRSVELPRGISSRPGSFLSTSMVRYVRRYT